MVRQIFETPEQLEHEARIAATVAVAWKCEVRKLPRLYSLDYCIIRKGEITGWFEVKRVKRTLQEHATVFVTMQKVLFAEQITYSTGYDCAIVYEFADQLAWAPLSSWVGKGEERRRRRMEFHSRNNPRDDQDPTPIYVYHSAEFKRIDVPPAAA